MATAVTVSRTNNPEIDGLLVGTRWTGTITYSFPDSASDYASGYSSNNEPTTGFAQAPGVMRQAITYSIGLILSYTNASIQFAGYDGADIRVAQSSAANPTSYAYYPSNNVKGTGGDVWFGTAYNYSLAALGNYYFATGIHELGHAFGLKHSQETGGVANVAVPTAHDGLEYTVMSYRSYIGGPATGYTNEAYGYPQTYMANDILALQTLYGANFTTHSENTVYSWNPATGQEFINGVAQLAPGTGAGGSSNRVFITIWDGNGVDTYDLSNYATPVTIDLNPGASSITSSTQTAYLGNGQYAAGNIYNAYLYNTDARSYIDNAVGGSSHDRLTGNAIANNFNGGGGNDTIIGNGGTDTAVFSGGSASYLISYDAGADTFTVADQRGGSPDGTDTITGVENFQFADGTFASSSFAAAVNHTPIFAQPAFQFSEFAPGAGGWSSNDTYPRELADVNGDGMADIVGFATSGVYVSLATGGGSFGASSLKFAGFGAGSGVGGWSSNDAYPRVLADVNGDGMADIVGFGDRGVYVALATGGGSFGASSLKYAGFGNGSNAGGWSSNDRFPRELADVNGDHKIDIVGFGDAGVSVALGNGDGSFEASSLKYAGFGNGSSAGGWSSNNLYPRTLADVNGDGMADIVGFGDKGVSVAFATGGGSFGPSSLKLAAFGASGWSSNDRYPRELADVNGDGKIDIVGFGEAGVYLALGNGDGSFQPTIADLHAFGAGPSAGGWTGQDAYPRLLADVNHDGAADIVGFGYNGVYEALSNGFHLV